MPANRKPKAWNLKPQMTAAPELWEGAVAVYPFWEGTGSASNATTMNPNERLLLTGNASWRRNIFGRVITSFGSGDDRSETNSFPDIGNSFSIVVFGSSSVDAQVAYAPLSANGKAGAGRAFKFLIQDNGSGSLRLQLGDGFIGVNVGNFNYLAGQSFILAGTYDGAIAKFYVNGALNDTANTSMVTFTSSFFTAAGNLNEVGSSLPWNGDVSFIAAYNRVLDESEIFKLSNDPFAMLRPAGF